MTIDLLAKIPLFADLPQNDLEQILAALDVKEMQDQAILFHEGDPGEHFYMVARGQLEVLMAEGKTEELLLNLLTVGEYLGEMSLILPGGHRTASVRSRGASTLLCMSRLQFLDLTKKYPELSRAMVRVLSQRLDAANTQTFHELTDLTMSY